MQHEDMRSAAGVPFQPLQCTASAATHATRSANLQSEGGASAQGRYTGSQLPAPLALLCPWAALSDELPSIHPVRTHCCRLCDCRLQTRHPPGSTKTLRTATSGKGPGVPPSQEQGMRRVVSSPGTSAILRCAGVVLSAKYCFRDSSNNGCLREGLGGVFA